MITDAMEIIQFRKKNKDNIYKKEPINLVLAQKK